MKLSDLKKKRAKYQKFTWLGLPLVVVAGWFYPLIGFLLLGCMVGALGVALFRGRAWCDWMCPRGAFYDLFIKKASRGKRIPALILSPYTRAFMVALLMSVLGVQTYRHWGDWPAVGLAFVTLLTVTTLVGIILGLIYKERAWCAICPMGTIGALISTGKEPLSIKGSACNDCTACAKACPMQIDPAKFKTIGTVKDNDCIKCSTCVAVCGKKALSFKKAA